MADPVVHITNGIPDVGTGNITTLGQTLIDGANFTWGATTDVAVAAGAVGSISAKLRSISRDLVGGIVLQPGANTIGAVTQAGAPWSVSGTVGISGSVTVTGTVAATQSGTWNINNISGTITLPSGAATAAKQPALGVAGTPSTDVLTVQGATSMTPLKVDGSAVTQPISGNVGITGTVSAVQSGVWNVGVTGTVSVVQGGNFTTRIVGNLGGVLDFASTQNVTAPAQAILTGAEYNTVPTTLTSGNASPLQLDSSANLLVNVKTSALPAGAATSANQTSAAAQGSTTSGQTGPLVQGAVTTASPSYTTGQTSPLSLDTSGNLRVNVVAGGGAGGTSSSYGAAFPATGTAIGVKDSAGTNMTFLQVNASNALKVDGSAVTQPVSGTFWQATQPVSGTFWQATQPVSIAAAVTVSQGTAANLNATVTGTVAATQSGAWNITNITGTVSLPTGAATAANQCSAAALGSTTSGQTGHLALGAVTTAAPTYTTAQSNALSLTTAGALRVDGSAVTQPVSGTFWQATQPVSGTVTVQQGTAANLNATVVGTVTANQGGTWTSRIVGNAAGVLDFAGQNATSPANAILIGGQFNTTPTTVVNGNSSPLQLDSSGNLKVNIQAGAGSGGTASSYGSAFPGQGTAIGVKDSTGTNMTNLKANASNALVVDGSGVTQPVSGTFWQATQPVSGTVAATQSGNWTSRVVGNAGAILDGVIGAAAAPANMLAVGGVYNSTRPSPTTGQSCSLQLGTSGLLLVDGSNATQPVSGTFWQATQPVSIAAAVTVAQSTAANLLCTASQGGTWNINNISGTVSLPTGAATAANQATAAASASTTSGQTGHLAMGAVTTAAPSYTTATSNWLSLTTAGALRVDNSAVTQPVSGTFWQATQPISAAALPLPSGASTSANQPSNAGQGSTTSGQTGTLAMGAVTTGNPTYTTAQTSPLSLDTSGALRVNVIAGSGGGGTSSSYGSAFPATGTAIGVKDSAGTNMTFLQVNASNALKVDGSAVTQPISAASLPLPTGAATSANQTAALGVIGAATAPANMMVTGGVFNTTKPTLTTGQSAALQSNSSGILLVDLSSTAANATAIKVDGSAVTQPVSIAAAVTVAQATSSNLKAQVDPLTAASWGIGTATQNSASATNGHLALGQYNSSPAAITSGNMSPLQLNNNGALKVDASAYTINVSGLQANSSDAMSTTTTNVAANSYLFGWNGATWDRLRADTTNGLWVNVKATVTQAVQGDVASGTSDSGNPMKVGGVARTSLPTAVTTGQRVNSMYDKSGRQVVVGAQRELKGVQKTSITTASETTVVTAGAAGIFNDVYAIVVTNKSATSVFVDFKDATAGTTRLTLAAPANDTRGFTVPVDSAMVQAVAANNWTATVSSGVTSIEITVLYTQNQ